MERNAAYTIRFAALVGLLASVLVSTAAVVLDDRQEANRLLDRRRNVVEVAGLRAPDEALSRLEMQRRFEAHVRPIVIELATGDPAPQVDPERLDPRKAARDPTTSRVAPPNRAGVDRLPEHVVLYHVVERDTIRSLILPVEGAGLWSTLYGFIALSPDLQTVQDVTFYEHGETPGLGSQIGDASWQARWRGRRPFDADGRPVIEVVKGPAGDIARAPHEVDGLSGATLTGRGVTEAVRFWLGSEGFGPYLARYRREAGIP